MSADWFLEELGSIVTGKTPPQAIEEAYAVLGTPFLTPKDMDGRKWVTSTERYLSEAGANSVKKSLIPAGSISVSCIGTVGKVVMVPVSTVTNQQINSIIPDKTKCNPEYLYYLLSTMQQELQGIAGGTVMPILNKGHFSKIQVRLPSINYQLAAAKILSGFDDKIQLNCQTNKTLEQMAQAIFKSWFIDFEPVKAKITALEAGGSADDALLAAMQTIAGNALFASDAADADAATQLARLQAEHPEQYATLRATAELFPSAMQESELGEVPEKWVVDEVSSQVDVLNGFAFKSGDYVEEPGVFVLRTKNFNSIGIAEQQHDDVFLPEAFNVSHKKYLCEPYDYHLIMVGASVGKRGIIFPSNLPAIRNQNMWCFRPKIGAVVGKAFTKYMVDELTSQKIGLASGSAREFFRKGDFQNQKICFANVLIQKKFDEVVFPLLEKQAMNIAENEYLSNLRDSLLPKLLSGELSVSAAADQITQAEEAVNVQS